MDVIRYVVSNSVGLLIGFMGMNMAMNSMPMLQPQVQSSQSPQQHSYNNTAHVDNADTAVKEMVREEWTCECGRVLPIDFEFCPKCGRSK